MRNARVVDAYGTVEKQSGSGWRRVSVGDVLPEGTTLRTGSGGVALLLLQDGHRVRVGEKTTVALTKLGAGKSFALNVTAGQIWSLVRKASQPASFRVETPSAVAGVTGTLFGVAVDEDDGQTVVDTDEGCVEVEGRGAFSGKKRLPVRAGQFTLIPYGEAKARPAPGRPQRMAEMPGTYAHRDANRRMWQQLKAEGGWARQDWRGPLRLRRGGEERLRRWWKTSSAGRVGFSPGRRPGAGAGREGLRRLAERP